MSDLPNHQVKDRLFADYNFCITNGNIQVWFVKK